MLTQASGEYLEFVLLNEKIRICPQREIVSCKIMEMSSVQTAVAEIVLGLLEWKSFL